MSSLPDTVPAGPAIDERERVLRLQHPLVKSFLAGMVSGTCSAVLFQPLDVVKTQMQNSIRKGQGAVSILNVCRSVIRQKTIFGLWMGLIPSLYRMVPGIGIHFTCIHYMRSRLESRYPRPVASFLVGGIARTVGTLCVLPFTVMKTRYESGSFNYGALSGALVNVYKTEGIRGLFSGVSATLLRDVPFSGLYFMFYSQLNKLFSFSVPDHSDLPSAHFVCGLCSGAFASFVTQPADVVKTHMQLYPKKYGRLKTVFIFVYEKDGAMGFWRGLVPRTARRTMVAALSWTVYEEVMRQFGLTMKTSL
ncbi:hypothetical protein ScPMuIL_004130 [Solemya velum]